VTKDSSVVVVAALQFSSSPRSALLIKDTEPSAIKVLQSTVAESVSGFQLSDRFQQEILVLENDNPQLAEECRKQQER
jgi:hypothetical protein